MDYVKDIVKKYNNDRAFIISILQDLQEKTGYLKREDMFKLSKILNMPVADIYRIATFFKAFSLTPRGKNIIQICLGTACHVRGGDKVLLEFENKLNIQAGETTTDGNFTLETVNCLGACALGPVVVVNQKYYGNMNTSKVKDILNEYK